MPILESKLRKIIRSELNNVLNEALPPEALEKFKALKKYHDDLAKQPLRFQIGDTISNETNWTGTKDGTPVIIPARSQLTVREINSTTSISVSPNSQQELEIPQSVAQLIKKDFVNVDENSIIQIGGSQIRKSKITIDL